VSSIGKKALPKKSLADAIFLLTLYRKSEKWTQLRTKEIIVMIKKIALAIVSLGLVTSVAMAQTTYPGNGATGFGGTIGGGSLTLTDDGTTISGTLTAGAAFNDGFVIYIDSIGGGADASVISQGAGFTDTADSNRHAITAVTAADATRSIGLPIAADFAIALLPAQGPFGGLWSLSNGTSLPFVASTNLLPLNSTGPVYTFSFNLADIGLTAGQSFNFVTTYLNGSNGFLSNETLAGTTGLGATNPGDTSVTLAGFQTYTTTAVPEPATVLLVGPAILAGMFFVRRRRA
jgi:hypothetical protein